MSILFTVLRVPEISFPTNQNTSTNVKGSIAQAFLLIFDSLLQSLSSLKAEGQKVNEHNAVTPDMMSRLMKDLESPEANPKAAELFAKRKAMSHGEDHFPCLPPLPISIVAFLVFP